MLLLGRKIQCCWSGEELQGSGSVDEDEMLLVWRQAQQDKCIDEAKMLVRREISCQETSSFTIQGKSK